MFSGDYESPPIGPFPREVKDRLLALLTIDQLDLMRRVLVDDDSQYQIARDLDCPRTTVMNRLHAACRRLAVAGITLPMPRPGRRREHVDVATIDVADLGDLKTERGANGITHGRWVKSRNAKVEASDRDDIGWNGEGE